MRILDFGSLNIDYVYRVPHMVKEGETLASSSLSRNAGGKGLNQALALGKAGAKVGMAGKVGAEGAFLVDALKEGGVDTACVGRSEEATGHAIIQLDSEGRNCIIIYGGANRDMDEAFIDRALENYGSGDLLLLQNEIASIPLIIEKAHAKGLTIVMNPSPLGPELAAYPLELVDLFILNEIEAAGLASGFARLNGPCTAPEQAARELLSRRPGLKLVVTLGSKGAFYADRNGIIKRPAVDAGPVVDTTAAGDTFTGYFLAAAGEGMEPAAALELAGRAAGICVTRPGAAPSIPDRAEVDSFRR